MTSPTHAYLRTALRDIACDWWSEKTHAQIVSAETQDLKSVGHASEVCSLFMACRILDIIYTLEHPNADDRLKAPDHQRLHVDFSSFKVSLCFLRTIFNIFTLRDT